MMKTSLRAISAFNSSGVMRRTLSPACTGAVAGAVVATFCFSLELQPVSITTTTTTAAIELRRIKQPPELSMNGERADIDFQKSTTIQDCRTVTAFVNTQSPVSLGNPALINPS